MHRCQQLIVRARSMTTCSDTEVTVRAPTPGPARRSGDRTRSAASWARSLRGPAGLERAVPGRQPGRVLQVRCHPRGAPTFSRGARRGISGPGLLRHHVEGGREHSRSSCGAGQATFDAPPRTSPVWSRAGHSTRVGGATSRCLLVTVHRPRRRPSDDADLTTPIRSCSRVMPARSRVVLPVPWFRGVLAGLGAPIHR
jgi:hypothetical protein